MGGALFVRYYAVTTPDLRRYVRLLTFGHAKGSAGLLANEQVGCTQETVRSK